MGSQAHCREISGQPALTTRRLVLRPFDLADALEVRRLAGDHAIADTTLEIPHPYEEGMAEQWIATHPQRFTAGDAAIFAITLRAGGALIGATDLRIARRFDSAELGYWIGQPHWGLGYCTEAGSVLLEYGFTGLDLNRIHACHFSRNPASGRVLAKLGMRREGVARQQVKKWDRYEDVILYAILREEWAAMRQGACGRGA